MDVDARSRHLNVQLRAILDGLRLCLAHAMVDTLQAHFANTSDLAALQALYRELDAAHASVDADLGRRDDQERARQLKHALNHPHACLIVVRDHGRAAGFLMACFAHQRPDVIIEAIMVSRQHRRRGIGTSLMRRVEEWARERRVRFIDLDVYEFNPEARAFYESLGYLTVERRMRRDPKFDLQRIVGR